MKLFAAFVLMCASVVGAAPLIFENADFYVECDSNMNNPEYAFHAKTGNDTSSYTLKFSDLNEPTVGGSNVALSPLNWQITQEDSQDGLVFWINATNAPNACGGSGKRFQRLSFRNTLLEASVKFDVILDGYKWCSTEADQALNFVWQLRHTGEGLPKDVDIETDVNGTSTIRLPGSEVFYSVAGTAQVTGGNDSTVTLSYNTDGETDQQGIQMAYSHFSGDLFHDPEFGVGSGPVAPPSENVPSDHTLLYVAAGAGGVAVLALGFYCYIRKTQKEGTDAKRPLLGGSA